MMSPNESTLIAYIEGSLDDAARTAVDAYLAAHPNASANVRRLVADRAALLGTADPELPRDFVAELEPMLARPMLMDNQAPGEYRRRQRRERSRERMLHTMRRMAQAAIVLLVAGAGFGAALLFVRMDALPGEQVATQTMRNDAASSASGAAGDRLAMHGGIVIRDDVTPDARAAVHHRWPVPATGTRFPVDGSPVPSNFDVTIPLRLALVLGGPADRVTRQLVRHVRSSAVEDSLIRNVDFDDTAMASADGVHGTSNDDGAGDDRVLAGTAAHGPDGAQQITWSNAGAAMTLTMPARDVAALLESLVDDGRVGWRHLASNRADDHPAMSFTATRDARLALLEAMRQDPEALVMIPVIVSTR